MAIKHLPNWMILQVHTPRALTNMEPQNKFPLEKTPFFGPIFVFVAYLGKLYITGFKELTYHPIHARETYICTCIYIYISLNIILQTFLFFTLFKTIQTNRPKVFSWHCFLVGIPRIREKKTLHGWST